MNLSANSIPVSVKRKPETGLEIRWSTGEICAISPTILRQNCPCASCLEKRGDTSHQKPLSAKKTALKVISASIEEETDILAVWPVGNYAIGMRWGDKHDSGIYTFELLRKLSQE